VPTAERSSISRRAQQARSDRHALAWLRGGLFKINSSGECGDRSGTFPAVCVMIDLDFFQQVNALRPRRRAEVLRHTQRVLESTSAA